MPGFAHFLDQAAGIRAGAILLDPPWKFQAWSSRGEGRSASRHYRCSSVEELKRIPIPELAADDCVLFMWTPDPHLFQASELFRVAREFARLRDRDR